MNEFFILSFAISVLLGIIAVFFAFKLQKTKKRFEKQEQELSRRLYEISVLNKIQKEIGYSLNLKSVVETITSSLDDLIIHSSVSYAILDEDKVLLKTYVKEPIGEEFLKEVKEIVLSSLAGFNENVKNLKVVENISGSLLTDHESRPFSYFNVPLVLNNKLIGIINVSSKVKNTYQDEDMTMLFRIINQSARTVEKLENLIETEKGKLNSFLLSISSGAISFLLEDDTLKLSSINNAAMEFLDIKGEPDTIHIISSFGTQINLIEEFKKVLKNRENKVFDDVEINNKQFKIILAPVILSGKDKIIGVSITMQDITPEIQLEKTREDFTNMVVHELRAPLISIRGASELLNKGSLKEEETKKMLNIIKNSTEEMLKEISDLLDAAKIASGKFSMLKELSDLNKTAQERVDAFFYPASEKKIKIELNLSHDIPNFEFDKERIAQIINNLLSNSIKFTSEEREGKIEIATMKEDGFAKVMVKDNGIGIPHEKQSLLFSEYAQIETIFSKQGTGLGLFISKGIVESHGGKIWLESEEGKGTTVYFKIPLINPQPKAENAYNTPYSEVGRVIN